MKCLIIVVGKSASGKDTLVNKVCEDLGVKKIIQVTTRPPRKNEIDGRDYKFITNEQFNLFNTNSKILASSSYDVAGGDVWKYGFLKQDIDNTDVGICITNPKNIEELMNIYEDKCVIFLIDADIFTRLKRSFNRDNLDKQTIDEILRRLEADEQDFKDLDNTYLSINNNENSYEDFKKYINIILEYQKRI